MMIILFLSICLIILAGAILNYIYYKYMDEHICTSDIELKKMECIIVMGAGVTRYGKPSKILKDRLNKAIQLYNMGASDRILVTGGKSNGFYEAEIMKAYLLKNSSICYDNILTDYKGECTFDSLYRANTRCKINSAYIVTNEYHLLRCLYLCKKMKIKAIGSASDVGVYEDMCYYEIREELAFIKDIIKTKVKKV